MKNIFFFRGKIQTRRKTDNHRLILLKKKS